MARSRFWHRGDFGGDEKDEQEQITRRRLHVSPGLGNGPVIDDTVIPSHQWDPAAPSWSADVPLMVGATETENGWIGPPPFELPDDELLELFSTELANGDRGDGEELPGLYRRLHPDKRNRMLWLTAQSDNARRWTAFNPDVYPTMMFGEEVRASYDPNREERLALVRLRSS